MRPWEKIISEEERQIYRAAGFGRPSGWGTRPALMIIDVQYRTVGVTPNLPLRDSMQEFPTSCGEAGWNAIGAIAPLLAEFRRQRRPVLYPYVAPKHAYDGGRLAEKVPTIMSVPTRGYDFVSELAPQAHDILIPKKHPSAFFGTSLASHLVDLGVDTVVVTGCTTSGCIRSTVVDAFSYNFKVVVPEECVYDRGSVSHAVSLFDISEKYGDVCSVSDVKKRLRDLTHAA